MLTKKVLDLEVADDYGEIFEFDLGDTSGIISYDISGGTSDASRQITLYGRIPGENVTATDAAAPDTAWMQLVQFTGKNINTTGGQLILLYPSVKCRITGNAGGGDPPAPSRVRVWVAYREGLGCA